MEDFYRFTRADLATFCQEKWQVNPLHANSLFKEAYQLHASRPHSRPGLPHTLQEGGAEAFFYDGVLAESARVSAYDKSVKFLAKMKDASLVETVLMPEKNRLTVCVSSQVGCAQACSFCHTGRMGLTRNLHAGEIVGQVLMANRWLSENPDWLSSLGYQPAMRTTNIVFMGMGEPLDNVPELSQALKIFNDPHGLSLSLRKISVSTAGHLDGIKQLLSLQPNVTLALSVHASSNGERSRLMPINRRWPISEVLAFLADYYQGSKRRVLVQYTVIRGVNDSIEHAKRLVSLLEGVPVKVNLIPLNDVAASRFEGPDFEVLQNFRDHLHQSGLRVMVRYSKGQDIGAACGQLVIQAKAVQS